MHPALAALTAIEAVPLAENLQAMGDWCDDNEVPFSSETRARIHELARSAPPPPPPPPPRPPHPRRTDTEELRALVERAEGMPPMIMEVARLCLFQGASLTQAAARLRISRETVRVHLRRLRAINKESKERRARRAAWDALCSLGAEDRHR